MTEFSSETLGCPFHTNATEAADRQGIRQNLDGVINPLVTELGERVAAGAVPVESLSELSVTARPYNEVRETSTGEHPSIFPEEERGVIVSGASDRFDSCLETDLSMVAAVSDLSPLRIPLGYDERYADRLIRAAAGVARSIRDLRPRIREVALHGDNRDLLLYHTYQGVEAPSPEKALERILSQGVALSAQAEAVLTADPVDGFGSARDLARAVRESDLPKDFTLRAGSGMLSTIVRHGRRIRHPVVRGEDAQLELSAPLQQYEKATRQNLYDEIQNARQQAQASRGRVSSTTGEHLDLVALGRLHRIQMYGAKCPAACVGVPAMLETIAYVADQLE